MESTWADRSFQDPFTVLKLRLRPYSCGHEILLSRLRSPLITGGNLSFDDLFVACLICSQPFSVGIELIRSPWKIRVFGWFWKRLITRCDLQSELAAFNEYLKSGFWCPPVNEVVSGASVRTLRAPRVYRLIPMLCAQLGIDEERALDFPLARANAYYAAMADKAGEIDLESEGDVGIADHLRDLEARAASGENVWDF